MQLNQSRKSYATLAPIHNFQSGRRARRSLYRAARSDSLPSSLMCLLLNLAPVDIERGVSGEPGSPPPPRPHLGAARTMFSSTVPVSGGASNTGFPMGDCNSDRLIDNRGSGDCFRDGGGGGISGGELFPSRCCKVSSNVTMLLYYKMIPKLRKLHKACESKRSGVCFITSEETGDALCD